MRPHAVMPRKTTTSLSSFEKWKEKGKHILHTAKRCQNGISVLLIAHVAHAYVAGTHVCFGKSFPFRYILVNNLFPSLVHQNLNLGLWASFTLDIPSQWIDVSQLGQSTFELPSHLLYIDPNLKVRWCYICLYNHGMPCVQFVGLRFIHLDFDKKLNYDCF